MIEMGSMTDQGDMQNSPMYNNGERYIKVNTTTPPWIIGQPSSPTLPQNTTNTNTNRGSFCGCLSIEFYQPYFDVDTSDVFRRWHWSIIFCRRESTFIELIGQKADAYGPFWNATTLIFLIAVTTNLSSWLAYDGESWQYDFTKVVTCASIIYGFVCGVPLLVWGVFTQLEVPISLIQVICIYGYAQGVYLPAVVLCTVPSTTLTWIVLGVAESFSTIFLLKSLIPTIMEHNQTWALIMMAGIVLEQLLFTLLLKFIFYP